MQIAIVVYCLYLKLGVSSLIGSAVTIIVMLPLQFFVGRAMSRNSEHGAVSLLRDFYTPNNIFQLSLHLFIWGSFVNYISLERIKKNAKILTKFHKPIQCDVIYD